MKSKDMWHGTVGISLIVGGCAAVAGIAYLVYGPPISYWPLGGPPLASNAVVAPPAVDLSEKGGTLFLCEVGKSLKAAFSANTVHLALSDGREIDLPQITGETGVRYANTDESFAFLNEADIVFVREDGVVTYSGCVAASQ